MHTIIKHTKKSSYESPRKSPADQIKQDARDFSSRLLSSKEQNDKKPKCKSSSNTAIAIASSSKPSSPSPDAEASFRVYYYGATGNVPFLWESAPGTPKHTSNDFSVPPLTPPPSYSYSDYSKSKAQNSRRAHKAAGRYRFSSPKIFSIISLPKLHRRRRSHSPTSTSTPTYSPTSFHSIFSSSSSSSFSPETPRPPRRRPSVFSRRRPQLFAAHHDGMDEEVDDDREGCRRHGAVAGAPKSWLMCFGSAGCFGGGTPSSSPPSSSSSWNGCYTVKNALSSSSVVGRRTVTYMA